MWNFVTSHYKFKDKWFKATKRRTRCSIYIRYPCGNIHGSCILHLYHVCMGVPVICDRNTTCSVIYTQVYTCHVHYCICQGLTTWQKYHLTWKHKLWIEIVYLSNTFHVASFPYSRFLIVCEYSNPRFNSFVLNREN